MQLSNAAHGRESSVVLGKKPQQHGHITTRPIWVDKLPGREGR